MEADSSAEFYTVSVEDLGLISSNVRLISRRGMISIVPEPRPAKLDFLQAFQSLATRWRRETKHTSNINKAISHVAYQQIIGMGKAMPTEVTRLLLGELERDMDHWFIALIEINGVDVGMGQDTVSGAARKWLEWGRQKGYLIHARPSA